MLDMAIKQITGRQLRHKAYEETLAPGESLVVKKKGGKKFELKRVDRGSETMNEKLDRLLAAMPPEKPRVKTNLARIIIEERE